MEPIWPRVEELFCSALQQPESERETWVASQAGFDPEVREEARSLLAADRRHAELSLQTPAAGQEAPAGDRSGDELPEEGRIFGPYRTERLLGSGGMGAVYLARRADGQFDQTVAIKVIDRKST